MQFHLAFLLLLSRRKIFQFILFIW